MNGNNRHGNLGLLMALAALAGGRPSDPAREFVQNKDFNPITDRVPGEVEAFEKIKETVASLTAENTDTLIVLGLVRPKPGEPCPNCHEIHTDGDARHLMIGFIGEDKTSKAMLSLFLDEQERQMFSKMGGGPFGPTLEEILGLKL